MHRTIEFASTWKDDSKFDEHGNQIAPGAFDLAEAIAFALSERTDTDPTAIEQHSFYGWALYCRLENAEFYCVFNPAGDRGYLTIGYLGYWFDWLCGRQPKTRFAAFSDALEASLGSVDGVFDLKWLER